MLIVWRKWSKCTMNSAFPKYSMITRNAIETMSCIKLTNCCSRMKLIEGRASIFFSQAYDWAIANWLLSITKIPDICSSLFNLRLKKKNNFRWILFSNISLFFFDSLWRLQKKKTFFFSLVFKIWRQIYS